MCGPKPTSNPYSVPTLTADAPPRRPLSLVTVLLADSHLWGNLRWYELTVSCLCSLITAQALGPADAVGGDYKGACELIHMCSRLAHQYLGQNVGRLVGA
jgi:hypothetical protein